MRKYLLLALALTTSLSATAPTTTDEKPSTTLTGFYAGILAGGTHYSMEGSLDTYLPNHEKQKSSGKKTSTGYSLGVMAGYGQVVEKAYLGAEIGLHIDNTPKKKSYKYNILGQSYSIDAKYNRGIAFSIAPRIGFVFTDSSMIYVKPALEVSYDKSTDESGPTRLQEKNEMRCTFVPSIGLEKTFSKILTRLEYSYNLGATTQMRENGIDHSLKYTSHAVKLGLAYKF